MANEKDEAFKAGIAEITKEYGKGTIFLGNESAFAEVPRIPTGSIGLDLAMGGGWAKGRIVEIFGPASAGKTTLTLHAIAECQKMGGKCAFVDMEHALDTRYASNLKVNVDKLAIAQPGSAEQALNIAERLARTGAVDLIVIDSVSALVPEKEIEGEIGEQTIGLQARLMSQAMRILATVGHQTGCTFLFINQIRMKIGVMYGNPEVVSGGNALKFYASQRLDIRQKEVVKVGEEKVGISSLVKVVKSKVSAPFREAQFNIIFGEGIDWADDLLTVAVDKKYIDRTGAWYSYKNEKIGQGAANAARYLREHPDVAKQLRDFILAPAK